MHEFSVGLGDRIVKWMKSQSGHSSNRETIAATLQRDNFPSNDAIARNCMVSSFRSKRDLMWLMCLLHFCIQIKLSHYVPLVNGRTI